MIASAINLESHMLFTHLSDASGRETTRSELPEVEVLKGKACAFGPTIGNRNIGQSQPQAHGGFVTSGAYAACQGQYQQAEQHRPTTTLPSSSLGALSQLGWTGLSLAGPYTPGNYSQQSSPSDQPSTTTCAGGTQWDPNLRRCECPQGTMWNADLQWCQGIDTGATYSPASPKTRTITPLRTGVFAPTNVPGSQPGSTPGTTPGTPGAPVDPYGPYASPWYKNWKAWLGIALGVTVIVGGGYLILRKPKAATP